MKSNPVVGSKQASLEPDRQSHFSLKRNAVVCELDRKRFLIDRFGESAPQRPMDVDAHSDRHSCLGVVESKAARHGSTDSQESDPGEP
jgi:hypothetical protein